MAKMRMIFRSRSHEMMLRFYFTSRIQEAAAGIALPKNVLLDDIPCITDSDLRHIFTGDEESLSIVPKLTAWLREEERGTNVSSTISRRLARWIVCDMPSKNTGDIGVPETLSASLPYLDRLAIICSIGTAFLCRLASGTLHAPYEPPYEPTETAWELLSDGVGKEMYEWDSSFVSR